MRELVLAELETGEKSRQYLNTVAEEKLGASPDTVYQSGLNPLRKEGRIGCRKEGLEGGWFWHLSARGGGELVTVAGAPEVGGRSLLPPITLSTAFSFLAICEVPTTDLEGLYRVLCRGSSGTAAGLCDSPRQRHCTPKGDDNDAGEAGGKEHDR